MTMAPTRLAVVVPTRNRPKELRTLLANLGQQTRAPDTVVVVDSSDEGLRSEIRAIVRELEIPCFYREHWPPSAAAQRNAGLAAVLPHADLVALLDDDLTIDTTALENACAEIQHISQDFIGFGFNATDENAKRGYGPLRTSRFARALGLYSERIGAVTKSGWHTRLVHVKEPTEVEWLLTGAVIWRAEAIRNIYFDEVFDQYSYLEDLEFSLQARKRGRFIILPTVTYLHEPAVGGRKSPFWFGRIEVRNRYYIVRKHNLSVWRFWFGTAVRAGLTLIAGVTRDSREMGRFFGNLSEVGRTLLRGDRL